MNKIKYDIRDDGIWNEKNYQTYFVTNEFKQKVDAEYVGFIQYTAVVMTRIKSIIQIKLMIENNININISRT